MTAPVRGRLLVVEDEVNAADALAALLRDDGYEVTVAYDAENALKALEGQEPDLVLTDLRLPGLDGIELLGRIKQMHPATMVILMTAFGTVKNAVKAMKLGAEDYLTKPVDVEELELAVERALDRKSLLAETGVLRQRLEQKYRFDNLVGESPQMLAVLKSVRQIAPSNASVLLLGESGTGKELFAQAIHENSPRKRRPFVKVACAALPETLLESELFGHEKGSFTGAIATRAGRFETADGGTLFLDEIGDISPTVQVKLLRFLEEHEFERVGGNRTIKVDVRVVAATHRDLKTRIKEGIFREDLYYRLNVIELHIPPLRERHTDIPLLAHHFLARFAAANDKEIRGFSDEALGLLLRHSWPGNVRELENAVERAVVISSEPVLSASHFPTLAAYSVEPAKGVTFGLRIPGSTLDDIEREAIQRTLESVSGSTSRAAQILGISPRKIQYKLKEYQSKAAVPVKGRKRSASE
jgi:DNA-binding NtrC family response regulator